MQFTEILATLPAIDHIVALELSNDEGLVTRLENKPDTAGSVRVYHALTQEFGRINATAATKGLTLYAEHTADAKAFPGKHPNIDRLLALSATTSVNADNQSLSVRLITR